MKFSMKNFFSKYDQIRRKLHFFCAVYNGTEPCKQLPIQGQCDFNPQTYFLCTQILIKNHLYKNIFQ